MLDSLVWDVKYNIYMDNNIRNGIEKVEKKACVSILIAKIKLQYKLF